MFFPITLKHRNYKMLAQKDCQQTGARKTFTFKRNLAFLLILMLCFSTRLTKRYHNPIFL